MAPQANKRPKVLITNDDGIAAPGLRALVAELVKADVVDVFVCAPSGERSAQSHAITLGRYMSAAPTDVPGAVEAFAVDGTPADSVMLALHSPLFASGTLSVTDGHAGVDLVVSGINRGDNCGLHVLYSGTVGAAREATSKGIPAIALSLDNHLARRLEDYALSAQLGVAAIKAALGLLPGQSRAEGTTPAESLRGGVLNINFPILQGQMLQGFHLTHQSLACVFPAFKEVQEAAGPHLPEVDEHTPNSRVFRNYAGVVQEDDAEGSDAWAVKRGWVSVTPLGLRQDLMPREEARVEGVVGAACAIIKAAAQEAGVAAAGVPAKL